MQVILDPNSVEDYQRFLAIKRLPKYRIAGRLAEFPDEYSSLICGEKPAVLKEQKPKLIKGMFDYQSDIAKLACRKRKFAVFMEPGYGKTLIDFVFAKYAELMTGKKVLLVAPLMVVKQMLDEWQAFCPGWKLPEQLRASELSSWLLKGKGIGISNYEALTSETPQGNLGGLILSESSMLKSHYGKWGAECIRLGKGLDYKLCETGTPAPNDRIEYANHAVFLDEFPTVNSFLAKYFVNKGQTDGRWEIKPHALGAFYRDMSHWCIFMTNPGTYGWQDNTQTFPPIRIHIHDVGLTDQQQSLAYKQTGMLFATEIGGIQSRSVLSQIAKGSHKGADVETLKPAFIKALVEKEPERSTIIWCLYNREQEAMAWTFPEAANISGDTPFEERMRLVDDFKAGRRKIMISKGKILGFGLNLQICTRMIFSGLQDSYETFYQCIKRANRVGSTEPLEVHIPVTDIERPMIETVLQKAERVQHDSSEQERIFKENGYAFR